MKMRKSQESALRARPYALHALKILQGISGSVDWAGEPLAEKRTVRNTCFVVVTSDRGLAGSLNSSVLKEFSKFVKKNNLEKNMCSIVSIGKRGREYFSKRGFTVIEHHEQWGDFVDFQKVEPLVGSVQSGFLRGEYDQVFIIYTNFISTLRQEVCVRKVLPVTFEGVREIVESIIPETGKYAHSTKEENIQTAVYEFEPNAKDVLSALVPVLLKIQIYHSILEANASEHSARMIAMKNASDNAKKILKDLRLSYNKARQGAITREVSEIVGGMEALV